MLSLITPENLPGILTAIGAILSGIGGWTLWKVRKEPAAPGTSEALLVALAENTRVQREMGGQFGSNLAMFADTLTLVRDIRSDISAMREHLNAIREQRK